MGLFILFCSFVIFYLLLLLNSFFQRKRSSFISIRQIIHRHRTINTSQVLCKAQEKWSQIDKCNLCIWYIWLKTIFSVKMLPFNFDHSRLIFNKYMNICFCFFFFNQKFQINQWLNILCFGMLLNQHRYTILLWCWCWFILAAIVVMKLVGFIGPCVLMRL